MQNARVAERRLTSVPQMPLLVVDPVPDQQRHKFLFERLRPMMLPLLLDICRRRRLVGFADRKRPITTLPRKPAQRW